MGSNAGTTNDPRLNLPLLHPKYTKAALPPATNWHEGSDKFLSIWRLSDNRVSIAAAPWITDADWWGASLAKIVDASPGLAELYLEHFPNRDDVKARILASWNLNPLDIRKEQDIQRASRHDWDLDADATEVLAAWYREGQTGAISGSLHWANPGAWGRVLAAAVQEVAETLAGGDQVAAAEIATRIRRAADESFSHAGPEIDLLSIQADPEWQVVTSRRNQGALDDWVEYLCVRRRLVPELTYEMAVCGFPPDDDDQEVDNHALQPMADNAVVDITDGGLELIAARLEQLEWPESDVELVVQAIAAM